MTGVMDLVMGGLTAVVSRAKSLGLWLALAGVLILAALLGVARARIAQLRLEQAAEHLEALEGVNATRRRMLEAGAGRPADRAALVERLRGGGI